MGTWMQIKYENTSTPAVQLLNQSQFLIIIQNWELGYCPDKRQIEIFGRASYKQHRIPLSTPTWAQGLIPTESCWWWWRGAGGMLIIFPFWPTSEITKQLCRDGAHGKAYRPPTGRYAELTQTDASAFFSFFFSWACLIYDSIRTADCISYLYIEALLLSMRLDKNSLI